jgi:hypothetical protein
MSENAPYQSQVHVTAFVVLRVKRKKVGLNKQLDTSYCRGGGGAGSYPAPNHVIGKRTVKTILETKRPSAQIFQNIHMTAVQQIFVFIIILVSG